MAKYDPDEFFSAERYPLPMKCSECGKTMRPVHKHCTPDMPRTYFCTFCGVGIYEDNPGIKFSKPKTNADRIRAMSDEELAFILASPCVEIPPWCVNHPECPHIDKDPVPCDECALDWLQQEVET